MHIKTNLLTVKNNSKQKILNSEGEIIKKEKQENTF